MMRVAVGPSDDDTRYTETVMKAWSERDWTWSIEGLSLHSYTGSCPPGLVLGAGSLAEAAIERGMRALAAGIAALSAELDVRVFVIGGGVSRAGEVVFSLGNAHIYENHLDAVRAQLERKPLPLPRLSLTEGVSSIDAYTAQDIQLLDYEHHPHLAGEVAV